MIEMVKGMSPVWVEALWGRPPTGGRWWLYHSFSAQLTMLAPPCSRAHSATRALGEPPRAGLVSALPMETTSHTNTPIDPRASSVRSRRRR